MDRIGSIFEAERPLIGMVHLEPLPGAPRHGSMAAVLDRARSDAAALEAGGMDGLIVENYGDVPFHPGAVPPETVAAMAVAVRAVVEVVGVPVGVNVLRNDAAAALGVCAAAGGRFIRVNVHTGAMLADQGWLTGRAHETTRRRVVLGQHIAILADVLVKHATPLPGTRPGQAAADAWHRGLADALIVSGAATGAETAESELRAVKAAVPEARVWVGSGLSIDNAARLLEAADGAIVGSALQRGGRAGAGVELERVRRLVAAARG